MTGAPPSDPPPGPPGTSLLIVATVAATIRQFLRPYARHFRDLGWKVEAAASGAAADPYLAEDFDRCHELPLSRSIRDIGALRRGARALTRILAARPDIVHLHTPIPAFLGRAIVRRMPAGERPRIAYTAHGFHFGQGGHPASNTAFLTAERVAGRWTDRLVVMNDEDEAAARRHRIVPASRLVRMPGIGLDTDFYARAALAPEAVAAAWRGLALDDTAPTFVVVGELSRRKRPADVVAALGRMRHLDARLVLAGAGPERQSLEAFARAAGLGERVRFLGGVEDVRPIVAGASALVLASSREGLNRSIMEALSLEVPVVASAARGNGELVGRDAGRIYPIGDVAALAGHLDWLIDHPEARDEMGRRGRARMVETYDVANLIGLHEAMYRSMLASPRRGER